LKVLFSLDINELSKTLFVHEHEFEQGLTQVHKTTPGSAVHPCVALLMKYKGQVL
jgi:hypothetical protein